MGTPRAMTETEIQVANFFAREDLEFLDCPLCTKPLLKQVCEKRKKARGHYEFDGLQETDTASLFFHRCQKCEHYNPPAPRKAKLTAKEKSLAAGWRSAANVTDGAAKAMSLHGKINPRPQGN